MLAYKSLTLARQAQDQQESITDWYYFFRDSFAHYMNNAYTANALEIFIAGQSQNAPVTVVFDQMERWRKRCVSEMEQTGSFDLWVNAPAEITGAAERDKAKLIRRYFGYLDMLILLADTILQKYPLSGEAVQIRKAIGETTGFVATEPEVNPEPMITDFPDEMIIKEAAIYLKSTVDTLYQLTSQKQIPHYKRGRRLIFILNELKRWRLSKVFTNDEISTLAANRAFLDAPMIKKT